MLSLPPLTTSTPSHDLHKQAANGITELIQARASLITQKSDWSILFAIIEYIGLGISPAQSNDVVAMVTTEEQNGSPVSHDTELQSDSLVVETEKEWMVIMETSLINSFDLLAESVTSVHEPQVCKIY